MRQVDRQPTTIGEAFAAERSQLLSLPKHHYLCCVSKPVKANGYSQVSFESNRYSVPTAYAGRPLLLRAFPFRVEILSMDKIVATHDRCFGKKQDVLEPLHYLSLLEQRPGAFDHAKPIRQWRESWPPIYEKLLADLRQKWPDGRGVREFVRILKLQRQHPAAVVERAVNQAAELGCMHHDGVVLCLNQLLRPEVIPTSLDLASSPQLARVGQQPLDLKRYNQLLTGGE